MDGRSYHGPLWRWYPDGKLQGKEYYLMGAAAGTWVSYYENGKMSSLGAFRDGQKVRVWKYFDDAEKVAAEVTYAKTGNHQLVYYPTGEKMADGNFVTSGKIGKWMYWWPDGRVKAECDFGEGLYKVPNDDCRIIAERLEPIGFSRPIQIATKSLNGAVTLSVGTDAFHAAPPDGWAVDVEAGQREEVPVVFLPKGKKWREPGPNMYIRVFFKDGRTLEDTVSDDTAGLKENVSDFKQGTPETGALADGRKYLMKSVSYKPLHRTDSPFSVVAPNTFHEQTAYIDATDKIILILVLAADSDAELKQNAPAFMSVLKSLH